jgi:hypothetical protein
MAPRPASASIKGSPDPDEAPHSPNSPPPTLYCARAIAFSSQSTAAGAPPPHRLPSLSNRQNRTPVAPSSFSPSLIEPHGRNRPGVGAPVSSPPWPCPWSTVNRPEPRSMSHGPRSHLSPLENNSKPNILASFSFRPLSFSTIILQSTNFQEDPWFSKIFLDIALATFQKFQIGPFNFFSSYLCNRNSNFGDSCAKFLRVIHSFISCIHNTCLLHIDWLHVCFMLGNAMLEPFFENFQDYAFEESQFFFVE